MTSTSQARPRLAPLPRAAALTASALLFLGGAGCAQQATTTGDTTTTTSTGGTGGTGGAGGTGGGVPTTCVESSECAGLNSPCADGVCTDGMCVASPKNDFKPCDDDNPCTTNDQCGQGVCAGVPKSCPVAPACNVAMCNPETGACDVMPGDDNAQCDDGDPCTAFGICKNGTCTKGGPIDCSLFDTDCTKGICDPAVGCKSVPANDGFACDDQKFCTIQEVCQGGVCGGGIPLPCAPPGGCFVGICDELADACTAVPGNDGMSCDDGSPCTAGTTCTSGVCGNGTPANEGMACNDGASCTVGEVCGAGICGGGQGPEVYFSEDFSDNSAGWILGTEWQIAPAKAGPNIGFAFPDPDTDHTPTADDGVAGVVIGGDPAPTPHGYYYLESPPFDTSSAAGSVVIGYYRWLNSDGHPNMHNRVDVWNGTQWITVWSSGDFHFETSWTFQQHDLTAYKNPQMRVRFGFDMGQFAFGEFSSWNIDDILVASAPCP
ncbi:MAG: hypothetical protein R3B70_22355 [Polyangiaceae bacterium]